MILGIVGNIRTGKTLLCTLLGYTMSILGFDVYSNYSTTFSKNISALDILDFNIDNGVILLDEVGTLIDSRNNSLANRLFSYFLNQSGKRDVHIIYTSQYRKLYDLRLDSITHILYKTNRTPDGFNYQKYKNEDKGLVYKRDISLSEEQAKPFYKLYETKEVIYAPELSGSNMMNFDEVKEAYNDSKTKKSFKILMRKRNPYISLETAEAVYDYIKDGKENMAKEVLGTK